MPAPQLPRPALAVQKRIDELCDEFEQQWRSAARPPLGDFLSRVAADDRPALLRELVALDCDYRRELGESPTLDDYLSAAPDSEPLLRQVIDTSASAQDHRAAAADSSAPKSLTETLPLPQLSPTAKAPLPEIPGYELLNFVAQGGMGVVYRARDVKLGREVAIKTPRSGYLSSPQEKDRFLREAVAAARLRHPNICPVFEVREANDRPYIAMAFIRGATLKSWRQELQPTPRRVAELMARIARAVQAAHDQGVIHRDLKPSNVMVEEGTGEPILMDFGLAKDLAQNDGLTLTGDLIGTPAYMAPEQAAGRTSEIGSRSDVYSLGAILYELLAGRPPFDGTLAEVLEQVQHQEPASIRRTTAQVHRDLETICVKAMAKRPAERYESAGAFADDLERFALGEPILARRLGPLQRSWRLIARYPVVSGLALLLGLAAAGGGVAAPALLQRYHASQQNLRASQQLSRSRQLAEELSASLGSAQWTPADLPLADRLTQELAALSPAQAQSMQRQTTQRLERYLESQVQDAARLGEGEYAAVQTTIANLAPRDARLAAEWKRRAEERRAQWVTRTDLKPPHDLAPPPFRFLKSSDDGQFLIDLARPPPPINKVTQIYATAEPSELNQKVSATFEAPNESEAGVVLNYINSHQEGVGAAALSPDAAQFAMGSQLRGPISLWETATRRLLFTLEGHDGGLTGLAFSGSGKLLVSSGSDGFLKTWDLEERTLLAELSVEPERLGFTEAESTMLPLAVADAGKRAYVGTLQGIEVFSLPNLQPLPALAGAAKHIGQLSISRDGRRLASSSTAGQVQMWDLTSGKELWMKDLPLPRSPRLALSDDGQTLACVGVGDTLRIFAADSGKLLATLQGQEGRIDAVAFDPAGKTVAVGYQTAAFKLWDWARQQVRGTLHFREQQATALRFDPQGRWLLLGTRYGLHQIDAAAVYRRWTLENQQYSFVVKRSADGRQGELLLMRNGLPLRQVVQPLAPGPVTVEAQREHETLTMQVNQNEPIRFVDYFPPQPIRDGVWAVAMSADVALSRATASSSRAPALVSQLELGDEQARRGDWPAALAFYEQQLTEGGKQLPLAVRQEAQLKRALCLQRLNRQREALERLQELATTAEEATPQVMIARFQWWLLLAQQERWAAANALAATIQAQHPYETAAQFVPFDTQRELYDLYARGVNRRSSSLLAGSAKRLETTLSLHEYLQWNMRDDGHLRWAIFEGFRVAGQHDAARALGVRIHDSLQPLLQEQRLATQASQGWDEQPWRRLGLLARLYEKSEPVVATLERLALDEQGRVSPAVEGAAWGPVVELARMYAARAQWEQALRLLEQSERAFSDPAAGIGLRIQLALLHGFVLRRLNRPEDGLAVWRKAVAHPQLAHSAADLESLPAAVAMELIVLRGVAGEVDDVFIDQFTGYLKQRMGASGVEQAIDQFPFNPDTLNAMWRSPRGLECAEQTARGDLLLSEQVKRQLMLYVHHLVRSGAGAPPSPEEDDLLWKLLSDGYDCYLADELSLATILQLGLAWKGVPPPLGWTLVFFGVPVKVKGGVAYFIARRLESREQAGSAVTLYKMARGYASADETLRRLADEGLRRLSE